MSTSEHKLPVTDSYVYLITVRKKQHFVQKQFLCQSEKLLNLFSNKPWFFCVCSTSHLKTLWEKEKLLVTSNFSFSPSVFNHFRELSAIFIKFNIVICKLFQFGRVQNLSFGKGLRRKLLYLNKK